MSLKGTHSQGKEETKPKNKTTITTRIFALRMKRKNGILLPTKISQFRYGPVLVAVAVDDVYDMT